MAKSVTCHICGDKIELCSEIANPSIGYHLINKHPDLDITHFLCEDHNSDENKCSCKPKGSQTSLLVDECFVKKKRYKVHKTVVENWRNGGQILKCPKCFQRDRPLVRKQKNKITFNPLGQCLLLGCWPICFLPLMMCNKTTFLVCCRKCGYCFGEYDVKSGRLCPLDEEKILELPNICPK